MGGREGQCHAAVGTVVRRTQSNLKTRRPGPRRIGPAGPALDDGPVGRMAEGPTRKRALEA